MRALNSPRILIPLLLLIFEFNFVLLTSINEPVSQVISEDHGEDQEGIRRFDAVIEETKIDNNNSAGEEETERSVKLKEPDVGVKSEDQGPELIPVRIDHVSPFEGQDIARKFLAIDGEKDDEDDRVDGRSERSSEDGVKKQAMMLRENLKNKTIVEGLRSQEEVLPDVPRFNEIQMLRALKSMPPGKFIPSEESYFKDLDRSRYNETELEILKAAECLTPEPERKSFAESMVECLNDLDVMKCFRILIWPIIADNFSERIMEVLPQRPIEITVSDYFPGMQEESKKVRGSGALPGDDEARLLLREASVSKILKEALASTQSSDDKIPSHIDPASFGPILTAGQLEILQLAEKFLPEMAREEYSGKMNSCVRRFEFFSCVKHITWPMVRQFNPALPAFPEYQGWIPTVISAYPGYPILPFPDLSDSNGQLPEVIEADALSNRTPRPETVIFQLLKTAVEDQPRNPNTAIYALPEIKSMNPEQLASVQMAQQLVPTPYRADFVDKTVKCIQQYNYFFCTKYSTWPTLRQWQPRLPDFPDFGSMFGNFFGNIPGFGNLFTSGMGDKKNWTEMFQNFNWGGFPNLGGLIGGSGGHGSGGGGGIGGLGSGILGGLGGSGSGGHGSHGGSAAGGSAGSGSTSGGAAAGGGGGSGSGSGGPAAAAGGSGTGTSGGSSSGEAQGSVGGGGSSSSNPVTDGGTITWAGIPGVKPPVIITWGSAIGSGGSGQAGGIGGLIPSVGGIPGIGAGGSGIHGGNIPWIGGGGSGGGAGFPQIPSGASLPWGGSGGSGGSGGGQGGSGHWGGINKPQINFPWLGQGSGGSGGSSSQGSDPSVGGASGGSSGSSSQGSDPSGVASSGGSSQTGSGIGTQGGYPGQSESSSSGSGGGSSINEQNQSGGYPGQGGSSQSGSGATTASNEQNQSGGYPGQGQSGSTNNQQGSGGGFPSYPGLGGSGINIPSIPGYPGGGGGLPAQQGSISWGGIQGIKPPGSISWGGSGSGSNSSGSSSGSSSSGSESSQSGNNQSESNNESSDNSGYPGLPSPGIGSSESGSNSSLSSSESNEQPSSGNSSSNSNSSNSDNSGGGGGAYPFAPYKLPQPSLLIKSSQESRPEKSLETKVIEILYNLRFSIQEVPYAPIQGSPFSDSLRMFNEDQMMILTLAKSIIPPPARPDLQSQAIGCMQGGSEFIGCTKNVIWPFLRFYIPQLPEFPEENQSIMMRHSSEQDFVPGVKYPLESLQFFSHPFFRQFELAGRSPLHSDISAKSDDHPMISVTDTRFTPIYSDHPDTVVLNILTSMAESIGHMSQPEYNSRVAAFMTLQATSNASLNVEQENIMKVAEYLIPESSRQMFFSGMLACLLENKFQVCSRDMMWPILSEHYPSLPDYPNFQEKIPESQQYEPVNPISETDVKTGQHGGTVVTITDTRFVPLYGEHPERVIMKMLKEIQPSGLNQIPNTMSSIAKLPVFRSSFTNQQKDVLILAENLLPEALREMFITRMSECVGDNTFLDCTRDIAWPTMGQFHSRLPSFPSFGSLPSLAEEKPQEASGLLPHLEPSVPISEYRLNHLEEHQPHQLPEVLDLRQFRPELPTFPNSGNPLEPIDEQHPEFPMADFGINWRKPAPELQQQQQSVLLPGYTASVGATPVVPAFPGQPTDILIDIDGDRVILPEKESEVVKKRQKRENFYEEPKLNMTESQLLQLLKNVAKDKDESTRESFMDNLNSTMKNSLTPEQFEILKTLEKIDNQNTKGLMGNVFQCIRSLSFLRCMGIFMWPMVTSAVPSLLSFAGFGGGRSVEDSIQNFFGLSTQDLEKELLARKDEMEGLLVNWYTSLREDKFQKNLGFITFEGYGDGQVGVRFTKPREGRGKFKDHKTMPSILTIISDILGDVLGKPPRKPDDRKKGKGSVYPLDETTDKSDNDDSIINLFLDRLRSEATDDDSGSANRKFTVEDAYQAFEMLFGPKLKSRIMHRLEEFYGNKIESDQTQRRSNEIHEENLEVTESEDQNTSALTVRLPRLDEEIISRGITDAIARHSNSNKKNKNGMMMPGIGLAITFVLQMALAHARAAASMASMLSNMAMGSAMFSLIRQSLFGQPNHPKIKYVYDTHAVGPGITWPQG